MSSRSEVVRLADGECVVVQRYGDCGLLIRHTNPIALGEACRRASLPAVVDVVPAAQSVLLLVESGADLTALQTDIGKLQVQECHGSDRQPVEIPVCYDGPDLHDVATLTGLEPAEVIAAHIGTPWRVAFGGFAPGFAYLVGGDPRLVVPRRSVARTTVPAGAVGLAGEFSGIYPRSSPGGWQLIGHTQTELWNLERMPPALLQPGAEVRFREG